MSDRELPVPVVFPPQALDLALAQACERSHCERRRGGLGKETQDAVDLLERIRVGFRRRRGRRIYRHIAGRILALEIAELLCELENSAHDALDVLQSVARKTAGADLIE